MKKYIFFLLLFMGQVALAVAAPVSAPVPASPTTKDLILKKETFVAGIDQLINSMKADTLRNQQTFDLLVDVKNRLAWNAVQSGYREVEHYLAFQRLINAASQLPVYWGMFSVRLMSWRNDLMEFGIIIPEASIPFSAGYDPLNQPVSWGFFDESGTYIAERDLAGTVFEAKNQSSYPSAAKRLAKIIQKSSARLSSDQLKTLARVVVIFKTAVAFDSSAVGFKAPEVYEGFKAVVEAIGSPQGEKLYKELKDKLEKDWKKELEAKGIMVSVPASK